MMAKIIKENYQRKNINFNISSGSTMIMANTFSISVLYPYLGERIGILDIISNKTRIKTAKKIWNWYENIIWF